ncbi:MAG: acyltransferase family protein [Cellulosilyticaceae bacterium]
MKYELASPRNFLFDNLKGILIFLVVFGHSLEMIKEQHILLKTIYIFIYMFHMPAFVFVSGYFSKNVDKCRNSAFKNFFIPFIIFNTLWNLISTVVTGPESFSFIIPGWALWYLISMFFWRIFLKDLVKIRYIVPISLLIGLGVGIFTEFNDLLSLSRTMVFLPFFLVGYFVTEYWVITIRKPHKIFAFFIIIFTSALAILIANTDIFPIEFLYGSASFESNTMPIGLGLVGRALLYMIGFAFIFVLLAMIDNKQTFFSKVGGNTFSVYILHTYLLSLVFVINRFIPNVYINLAISLAASIGITYLLSRNTVSKSIYKILGKVSRILLRS